MIMIQIFEKVASLRRKLGHDQPDVLENFSNCVWRVRYQTQHSDVLFQRAQFTATNQRESFSVALQIDCKIDNDSIDESRNVEIVKELVEIFKEYDVALKQILSSESREEGCCSFRWKRRLVKNVKRRNYVNEI